MTNPWSPEALRDQLRTAAGGYFKNPIWIPMVTCSVCTTPVNGYPRCYPCSAQAGVAGRSLADGVGFLTYAMAGRQAGYVMRGYKATRSVPSHRVVVALALTVGLSLHSACVGRLRRHPVTHWASVPSLAGRQGEHPIRRMAAISAPGTEVSVLPATTENPRTLDPAHFTIPRRLPERSHVLVVDDTWTTGAHAQSLVLCLRAAGAAYVSILAVARWLTPEYGNNAAFIHEHLTSDYRTDLCPYTGAACP